MNARKFLFDLSPLAPEQREDPPETEMAAPGGAEVDPVRWGPAQAALVEAAARLPEVDRLFVHPAVKRELCRTVQGERGWLRKVRPRWGRAAHFHLRPACPADSPACVSQAPLPTGEGCGPEPDWWFGPEAAKNPTPGAKPPLPERCAALLAEWSRCSAGDLACIGPSGPPPAGNAGEVACATKLFEPRLSIRTRDDGETGCEAVWSLGRSPWLFHGRRARGQNGRKPAARARVGSKSRLMDNLG